MHFYQFVQVHLTETLTAIVALYDYVTIFNSGCLFLVNKNEFVILISLILSINSVVSQKSATSLSQSKILNFSYI